MKKELSALAALSAALFANQAAAALPAGVDTAITTAGADMMTAAVAIITAMVAFWGIRKLGSKMGWW
jgi:hypothetical protein